MLITQLLTHLKINSFNNHNNKFIKFKLSHGTYQENINIKNNKTLVTFKLNLNCQVSILMKHFIASVGNKIPVEAWKINEHFNYCNLNTVRMYRCKDVLRLILYSPLLECSKYNLSVSITGIGDKI